MKIAEEKDDNARRIADEIEESLSKMGIADEPVKAPVAAPVDFKEMPTMKFEDLQFGKNYDPMNK